MIPVIIVSGHVTGLGVTRALGERGVDITCVSYDLADMGGASRYVSKVIIAPHPERDEKQFLQLLLENQSRIGRSVIIPADDASLLVISKNRHLFTDNSVVACPEYSITEKVLDKKNTYLLAESLGIPVPATYFPTSLEELSEIAQRIEYPCLVKPCLSHRYYELFRRKLKKVIDSNDLAMAWTEAQAAGVEVMVTEYIPGEDTAGVNYNSYFYDGKALVEFTAAKVRLSPPKFGVPSVVVSRDIPEILVPGRKILEALGFCGYSCIEFKKDLRDGIYKLMEVNGRHNRSTLLAVRCGINFPWMEYRHLAYREQPGTCSYRTGVYWIDEFQDLYRIKNLRSQEWKSVWQYGLPYCLEHVFSVFDWRDLQPFRKRTLDLLKKICPKPVEAH